MQVTDIAPCLVLYAAFVGLGALIGRYSPFYRARTEPTEGKVETLDGLRAYLALGVFFHHGVITYFFLESGKWDYPPTSFYKLLGSASISLFFMITSFLFWTKAIRGGARLPAGRLLIGRAMRVGPMYLVVSAVVYATILIQAGFRLPGEPARVALGLASPLALGLVKWLPINSVDPLTLNAEVNWTLQYEWAFYLALPLLAILARPGRFAVAAVAVLSVAMRGYPPYWYWSCLGFLAGMAVAHAARWLGRRPILAGRLASLACVALLLLLPLASSRGYRVAKLLPLSLLSAFFLMVVGGNSIFGILTTRGAKVLGTISYSIYLIHGFVLYLGRGLLQRWHGPGVPSPTAYWAFLGACGVATILISTITYRFVEHPFIGLSHRPGRDLPSARPPAPTREPELVA